MLKRALKVTAITLLIALGAAGVLYLAGVRVLLDGGARPYITRITPPSAHADALARHREAQRAQPLTDTAVPSDIASAEGNDASAQGGMDASETAADETSAGELPAATTSADAADTAVAARAALDWPSFRGAQRDGHYRGAVRVDWPAGGLTPLWKQPVGGGYASFAVAGGRAYTIEQRGPEEVVAAYDVATGRELWTHGWTALFSEILGGDGPRATPTYHDGRVFALGGTGELRALDARDGRLLWRTNILEDARAPAREWGVSGSPLIVDDTVVVTPGGPDGRSVVAYSIDGGRMAWSALDDQTSYASAMLVTLGGVRQILAFSQSRMVAITPVEGRVLWEYPWVTDPRINASQPVLLGDDRVFVSTGYGKGAAVIELTRTDDEDAPSFTVREVWRNIRMKNQFSTSIAHEGYLYGLDGPILACIDAATGDLKWKGGRYGYGQIMLTNGHLIVTTEGGDIALVRATPERHTEIARFSVFNARTWNHPVIADGILLVRNLAEMAAFDLRVR